MNKLDEETGLPLIGVPDYTALAPAQAMLDGVTPDTDARWLNVRKAMQLAQLRQSCGVDPGTVKFRRYRWEGVINRMKRET